MFLTPLDFLSYIYLYATLQSKSSLPQIKTFSRSHYKGPTLKSIVYPTKGKQPLPPAMSAVIYHYLSLFIYLFPGLLCASRQSCLCGAQHLSSLCRLSSSSQELQSRGSSTLKDSGWLWILSDVPALQLYSSWDKHSSNPVFLESELSFKKSRHFIIHRPLTRSLVQFCLSDVCVLSSSRHINVEKEEKETFSLHMSEPARPVQLFKSGSSIYWGFGQSFDLSSRWVVQSCEAVSLPPSWCLVSFSVCKLLYSVPIGCCDAELSCSCFFWVFCSMLFDLWRPEQAWRRCRSPRLRPALAGLTLSPRCFSSIVSQEVQSNWAELEDLWHLDENYWNKGKKIHISVCMTFLNMPSLCCDPCKACAKWTFNEAFAFKMIWTWTTSAAFKTQAQNVIMAWWMHTLKIPQRDITMCIFAHVFPCSMRFHCKKGNHFKLAGTACKSCYTEQLCLAF